MPKSPNGEERPADAIGLARMIGKIATREIEDERDGIASAAAQMGKLGWQGPRGGYAAGGERRPPRRRPPVPSEAAASIRQPHIARCKRSIVDF